MLLFTTAQNMELAPNPHYIGGIRHMIDNWKVLRNVQQCPVYYIVHLYILHAAIFVLHGIKWNIYIAENNAIMFVFSFVKCLCQCIKNSLKFGHDLLYDD